jgi:predicted nucleic acid-binding protein
VILIDTSIWVEADRHPSSVDGRELRDLIDRDEVATTDIVVAEVLQGAPTDQKFRELARRLEGAHFFHASRGTWSAAARLSFELRRQGQATGLSDLLVASVALENDLPIYAIDTDFQRVPQLKLYSPTGP